MKILQINKFFYLRGGTERYLFELSSLLTANGHQVISFSMFDSRNLPSKFSEYFAAKANLDRFSLISIARFFYNREAAAKLERLIEREKPDVAHLHNIAHHLSPSVIGVLKKHKIPIVQTLHDYKLICPNYRLFSKNQVCTDCKGGRYYNCLRRRCLKNSYAKSLMAVLEAYLHQRLLGSYQAVDLFIAPSNFLKNICVDFGVPAERLRVIYNFTRLDMKAEVNTGEGSLTEPGPVQAGQKSHFLTGDAAAQSGGNEKPGDYLLYFGRLSDEKGISVLLDAAYRLKEPIKIKLVGAGPSYQDYQRLIEEKGLSRSIELVGPKYGDELTALLNGAAASLAPSIWPENMPMSVLESLAAGIPVIASRIGGLPEIIEDGVNGFLACPGDAADLKDALERFSRADKIALRENARASAARFSPAGHYENIMKIYSCLIK